MVLKNIRICNFQSFNNSINEIDFDNITVLLGPNGSGKTALLEALARIFSFDISLRKIRKSDFHVPFNEENTSDERSLWIEVDFIFPELLQDGDHPAVAPHFSHMRLDDKESIPHIRFRLDASIDIDSEIEETLSYVLEVDEHGEPTKTSSVPRAERNYIHMYYLPARRDPADHITFSSNALIGRMLRAVNWKDEREIIKTETRTISDCLSNNISVQKMSESIKKSWKDLHKGNYFTDPQITFSSSEIKSLLKHLSISFSPGHDEQIVDFSRLSDGQKSMLYLSIVLSSQSIGRSVIEGDNSFDPDKLKPPVFTIMAIEEPENSLSPHYLGRIITLLKEMVQHGDSQALLATHAPSMLYRIEPQNIRYLRLNEKRESQVTKIILPDETNDAHKYVLQAVKAFPEIYFSRLVVLGEGDSEVMVLPKILEARGIPVDENAVTIAPLGGRHVNHFWRLLESLQIPYITLLDLDIGRFQGGWGRIKYVNDQLKKHCPEKQLVDDYANIPLWDDSQYKIRDYLNYLDELEKRNVFFSYPLDLDFAMILSYPNAYEIEDDSLNEPQDNEIKAVLGKSRTEASEYFEQERILFSSYHNIFKLGSKPAAHINAFSKLSNEDIIQKIPSYLDRMANAVILLLDKIQE